MAYSRKPKSFERPFTLSIDVAERITRVCEEHSCELKINGTLSDDSSITFDDLDELRNFPNSRGRQIISLEFESNCYGEDADRKVNILVNYRRSEHKFIRSSMSYEVRGEDILVQGVARDIDEIADLSESREPRIVKLIKNKFVGPYSLIFIFIGVLIGQAVGVFIIIPKMINKSSSQEEFSAYEPAINLAIEEFVILAKYGIFVLIFSLLLGFGKNLVLNYYPESNFLVGDGLRRYEDLINARKTAFGWFSALVIGLVTSGIIAYLFM